VLPGALGALPGALGALPGALGTLAALASVLTSCRVAQPLRPFPPVNAALAEQRRTG
jgi:hypothetical protein